MRILHAADLHLAPRLDYLEPAARRARREHFARHADQLPRLAREHRADVVLLAGDVFDRDIPALPEVGRLAAALEDCPCPVLIVPGTHDAYREGGVWDRSWPAHVTVFTEDRWTTLRVGDTAFHALASRGRPLNRPLFAGLPEAIAAAHAGAPGLEAGRPPRHHVALAHASLLWADVKAKVDPKNFPFLESDVASLDGELAERLPSLPSAGAARDLSAGIRPRLDYLALGDHHRHRAVRCGATVAAYPGSPEGLGFDPAEAGPRHVLVVDLAPPAGSGLGAPAVLPVAVQEAEVVVTSIDVEPLGGDSPGDVAEAVRRAAARLAGPLVLARVDLVGQPSAPLGIDVENIATGLGADFFALRLRDRTRVRAAPPSSPREGGSGTPNTIRTAFERRLQERIAAAEAAGDEAGRECAEEALRLGIQALENTLA